MTNPINTSKYDEERIRAAEQSQVVYLQSQIDELRRLLKDQSGKYSWAIEQVRKVESNVSQIEGLFERHRGEVTQSIDISRRDIAALRKEIAAALIKIEEGIKPIREMQAQIHQVAEARRQDRDHVASWLVRIEDLERSIAGWAAQIRESEERHRVLASRIESFTGVDDSLRTDIRKVAEDMQIEKQNLRRQAVEAQQLVTDLRPLIEAQTNRINRLEEIRQRIDGFIDQVPGQISALDVRINEHDGEIKRVERLTTERFLVNQERVEEIRHQQEEKLVVLQEIDDIHLRQMTTWVERLDSWVRELEQRHARLIAQVEEVQRGHAAHLNDLEQREGNLIQIMLGALRSQLETLRAEQIERGRLPKDES